MIFNFIGAHAIKNSMEGACIRIFTGNVMVKNVEYDYRLGLASSGDPKLVEHVADYIEAYEKEEGVTGCVARVRRGVQVTSEKTEYMNLIGVDTDREKGRCGGKKRERSSKSFEDYHGISSSGFDDYGNLPVYLSRDREAGRKSNENLYFSSQLSAVYVRKRRTVCAGFFNSSLRLMGYGSLLSGI